MIDTLREAGSGDLAAQVERFLQSMPPQEPSVNGLPRINEFSPSLLQLAEDKAGLAQEITPIRRIWRS